MRCAVEASPSGSAAAQKKWFTASQINMPQKLCCQATITKLAMDTTEVHSMMARRCPLRSASQPQNMGATIRASVDSAIRMDI